ncbi:unnamed protein product [Ectocarpus sp. 13 AM-2016]
MGCFSSLCIEASGKLRYNSASLLLPRNPLSGPFTWRPGSVAGPFVRHVRLAHRAMPFVASCVAVAVQWPCLSELGVDTPQRRTLWPAADSLSSISSGRDPSDISAQASNGGSQPLSNLFKRLSTYLNLFKSRSLSEISLISGPQPVLPLVLSAEL